MEKMSTNLRSETNCSDGRSTSSYYPPSSKSSPQERPPRSMEELLPELEYSGRLCGGSHVVYHRGIPPESRQ
jgi:hypothetical protein